MLTPAIAILLANTTTGQQGAALPLTKQDFHTPATTVQALIPRLRQLTGAEVRATPEIQDEVVYLNLRQRTPQEILDLLTAAITADWAERNGVLQIFRSPQSQAKETEREFTVQVKNIQAHFQKAAIPTYDPTALTNAVDGLLNHLAKGPNPNQNLYDAAFYQGVEKFNRYAPGNYLAQLFLSNLEPAAIAAQPPDTRITFSTNPTRLQRPWPTFAKDHLPFAQNALLWHKQALHDAQVPSRIPQETDQWGYHSELLRAVSPNTKPPVALLADVVRYEFGVHVKYSAFDETGQIVFTGDASASGLTEPFDATVNWEDRNPYKDVPGQIELTPEEARKSRELSMALHGWATAQLPKDLLAILADADTNHPAAGAPSRVLDTWLDQTGQELALSVGPTLLGFAESTTVPLNTALMGILYGRDIAPHPTLGALVGVSKMPLTEERQTPPVKAIARLARLVLERDSLTIDDIADLAASVPVRLQAMQLVRTATSFAGQSSATFYSNDEGLTALLAYSTLSKSQRANLADKPLTLDLNAAPPRLKAIVEAHIAGPHFDPAAFPYDPEEDSAVNQERIRLLNTPERALSQWQLQASVFPTLPKAAPVRITLSTGTADRILFQTTTAQGFSYANAQTLESAAQQVAWNKKMIAAGQRDAEATFAMAPVKRGSIKLTIDFGGLRQAVSTYRYSAERPEKLHPLDNLPEPLATQFRQALAKAEEQLKDYDVNRARRPATPPPP